MTRRAITGVLDSFLGTYLSRNSDYQGYWLFGVIADQLPDLRIDLLANRPELDDAENPIEAAMRLACRRFREQVAKGGVPVDFLRTAELVVEEAGPRIEAREGVRVAGADFVFRVSCEMDTGCVNELQRRHSMM